MKELIKKYQNPSGKIGNPTSMGTYIDAGQLLQSIKDLAYRIMSQTSDAERDSQQIKLALKQWFTDAPIDHKYTGSFSSDGADTTARDLNWLTMYGNTKGQYTPTTVRGFDYSDFIRKNYHVSSLPAYKGRIVNARNVKIPEEYKPLVEYLADRPEFGYYIDFDEEGGDDGSSNLGDFDAPYNITDDTNAYRRSFRRDINGNAELANQDIIDYGAGYGDKWGSAAGIQGRLLNAIINSPVILDQGLPVVYLKPGEDLDQGIGWYRTLENLVNNHKILEKLDNGYMYPLMLPDVQVRSNKEDELDRIEKSFGNSGNGKVY